MTQQQIEDKIAEIIQRLDALEAKELITEDKLNETITNILGERDERDEEE